MNYVIVGAGGHARTVIHTLHCLNISPKGVLDQYREPDEKVLNTPILDDSSKFKKYIKDNIFIIAIGDNASRMEHYNRIKDEGGLFEAVVHPTCEFSKSSRVGEGTLIAQQAVICPNSEIGNNVIINSRALVEHDAKVGNHAHIAPDVSLAGKVTIHEGAFIGLRAVVKDGVSIGRWAKVGAGAVVVSDVPDGAVVVGNPARIVSMDQHPSEPPSQQFPTLKSHFMLKDCMQEIDRHGSGFGIVTGDHDKVVGILTDGTIRRALLKGAKLKDNIDQFFMREFLFLSQEKESEAIYHFSEKIKFIPIVDSEKKLLKVLYPNDVFRRQPELSDLASRQIKELYKWVQNRNDVRYRKEALLEELQRCLPEVPHVVVPDAELLANKLLEKEGWRWSKDALSFLCISWNDAHARGEGAQVCLEKDKLEEGGLLLSSNPSDFLGLQNAVGFLRCGAMDPINLEGGAILFNPPARWDNFFSPPHVFQLVCALPGLKRLRLEKS